MVSATFTYSSSQVTTKADQGTESLITNSLAKSYLMITQINEWVMVRQIEIERQNAFIGSDCDSTRDSRLQSPTATANTK
jgi:hypothetical protein